MAVYTLPADSYIYRSACFSKCRHNHFDFCICTSRVPPREVNCFPQEHYDIINSARKI